MAHELRFAEAAVAWRKYLKQTKTKAIANDERLKLLNRAAILKRQSDQHQPLTIDQMVELIKVVDRFGSSTDAIPYAEKAVELYPQSAKALVALAELIKTEQQVRALELLDRAITLELNEPAFMYRDGDISSGLRQTPSHLKRISEEPSN